jgi:hypothetical protein
LCYFSKTGILEVIAKMVGLKKANGIDVTKQLKNFKGEIGDSIALFHVMERNETEILTGENDKHLNFRLSLIALPNDWGTEIQVATTVLYTS